MGPSRIPIKPLHFLFVAMVGTWVVWVVTCRQRRDWTLALGIQVFFAIAVQIVGMLYGGKGYNNHAYYNTYMVIEFGALLVMARSFIDTARGRALVLLAALPFTSVFIGEQVYYGTGHFASTAFICGGFTLVALYGYLMVQLVDRSSRPLMRSPTFWVFAGIVVYFAASAPIMGLIHYLMERDLELAGALYEINNGLGVMRYLAIAVGLSLITPRSVQW